MQLRVVNWNIRRLSLASFDDLHDAVTKSSERLQMDDWDVLPPGTWDDDASRAYAQAI